MRECLSRTWASDDRLRHPFAQARRHPTFPLHGPWPDGARAGAPGSSPSPNRSPRMASSARTPAARRRAGRDIPASLHSGGVRRSRVTPGCSGITSKGDAQVRWQERHEQHVRCGLRDRAGALHLELVVFRELGMIRARVCGRAIGRAVGDNIGYGASSPRLRLPQPSHEHRCRHLGAHRRRWSGHARTAVVRLLHVVEHAPPGTKGDIQGHPPQGHVAHDRHGSYARMATLHGFSSPSVSSTPSGYSRATDRTASFMAWLLCVVDTIKLHIVTKSSAPTR